MSQRRDLLAICAGSVVSLFGTALTGIALLFTLRTSGSWAITGLLTAGSLPAFLAAPLAGLLVDRLPNRRLMIVAEITQGGCVAAIALFDHSLPLIFTFLVLLGCGSAVARPAASALIPVVTGESGATKGYAWLSGGNSLGMTLGTAVGGVLVAFAGIRNALLIDALTYLVQAGLLLFVRAERRASGERHASDGAMAGLRHLFGDRLLRTAVIGLAVAILCTMAVDVAEVFFVTVVLHGGAITIGIVQAAWMVGLFGGARLAARIRTQRGLALSLAVAEATIGLVFGVPALLPSTAVIMISYCVGGIMNAMVNVCHNGLVRARTPEPLRGRTFAASAALTNVAMVIGTVAGGVIVGGVGPRLSYAVAGVFTIIAGLCVLMATSRALVAPRPTVQRTTRT